MRLRHASVLSGFTSCPHSSRSRIKIEGNLLLRRFSDDYRYAVIAHQCITTARQLDQLLTGAVSRLRGTSVPQAANSRLIDTHQLSQLCLAKPFGLE